VLDLPYRSPRSRLPRACGDVAIDVAMVWGGGSSFGTAPISSKMPSQVAHDTNDKLYRYVLYVYVYTCTSGSIISVDWMKYVRVQ